MVKIVQPSPSNRVVPFDSKKNNHDGTVAVERSATHLDVTQSSTHEDHQHQQQPLTTDAKIAKGARATVMLVLLLSAITVSTLSYVLLTKNENDAFQAEFESSARQVILMANRNAINVFTSLRTMAAMFPTNAQKSNETLPFVTVGGFEALASGFRNVSKASTIAYSPLLHTPAEIEQWSSYSVQNAGWIQEGRQYEKENQPPSAIPANVSDLMMPFVFTLDNVTGQPVPEVNPSGPYVPVWQMSPVPPILAAVNFNAYSFAVARESLRYVILTGRPILTEPVEARAFLSFPVEGPISILQQPIFATVAHNTSSPVVGFLTGLLAWKYFFDDILPSTQRGIHVVVESCNVKSTFLINGIEATFVGDGDLHDPRYNHIEVSNKFVSYEVENHAAGKQCQHIVHVFPTSQLEDTYKTDTPWQYSAIMFSIFVFAAFVFLAYDWFVTNRQSRTEQKADQSNAIVQELFPGDTASRLFGASSGRQDTTNSTRNTLAMSGFGKVDRSTIAELHPEVTVLFADISGFTAWSSMRDPHQVFTLLETIFQAFDSIAKRCGAFKVETVGDCYVAACGVPKENLQHAVVMCRFARNAMAKFRSVCRSLEFKLGPDTSDLALRIGMHSGPVTAGVLRGDRARFQLFGDTVNTAARLESTGKRERVHLSEQTANQLIAHGKEDWIVRREDVVEAKGKGKIVTYWLKLRLRDVDAVGSVAGSDVGDALVAIEKGVNSTECLLEMPSTKSCTGNDQLQRLVQWNSDLLLQLLQCVVSRRAALTGADFKSSTDLTNMARSMGNGTLVVDKVAEIIDMPEFVCATEYAEVKLSDSVEVQLRGYITEVASMYNDNPFHNFEHASHVTMSIHKLLTRIVAPKLDESICSDAEQQEALLHDHTCGITSDPLTQFAVVLSGLIHDLDHPGVSNGQLIQENPALATRYQEKSVAEQNSVDLAWNILLSSSYDDLRNAIFATKTELQRFRSLLVNSVIATDIFDKEQSNLRKNRWNKAFFETTPDDTSREARSRKATIVIEHLIQASDVAHTMQHWHVYQKWNQRLFNEMMMAYRAGRSDKDPSLGWYGGELWFFDNYVIPLTQKLKECGVFGVSSDEYLNYALHNRDEWESKGKAVVQLYVEEFEKFAVDKVEEEDSNLVSI